MRLLLFGATGGVGKVLMELALAHGHRITAVARDPEQITLENDALRVIAGDVTERDFVEGVVPGHHVVVCALGTGGRGPTKLFSTAALNVATAMESHNVRRLVFLSNFGVLNEAPPDLAWVVMMPFARWWTRHLVRDHRTAFDEIRRHDLEWTLVRPMILTDGPWTGRYRIAVKGLPPHGLTISRADVADFMLRQVEGDEYVCVAPAIAY